ncbi:MAG: hypothetical protein OXG85_14070 [Chloroflexi bacterium]|nr:hypothetical protein [Chloroflexota bacterium]
MEFGAMIASIQFDKILVRSMKTLSAPSSQSDLRGGGLLASPNHALSVQLALL